ncbi:MAG TPA: nickel pincer cofactor biosynthesis protein LarC [Candidatus Dormibacteraeota bacterium]|nr:nickel pincer cofactor biosynthesis protein LarC [Candidatus Dormibacteraeota bacterium]
MSARVAYFDCVHGAAGDMLLAALIDAGASLDAVQSALLACGVEEATVSVDEVFRAGVRGLHLDIAVSGAVAARDLAACVSAVSASALPPRLRERAVAALRRLGDTESRLHGTAPEHTHLHELGAVDTMVDIVGVCAALESLGVDDIGCSPLPVAPGTVNTEHGELPLPAPATLSMLAAAGVPVLPGLAGVEQVTPTAAALLTTLARFEVPAMRLQVTGHGAGSRDDPRRPNLVRCWLGDPLPDGAGEAPDGFDDPCVELRTNLDDVSPAVVADLAARCLDAGAVDVWVVAATMKKGRPGHVLHALVPTGMDQAVATLLLEQSPTLGVRRTLAPRMVAGRDSAVLDSPYGAVRVKRKVLGGRVVDARPELDDCRRLAKTSGRPLHEVVDTLTAAARAALVTVNADDRTEAS